MSTEAVTASEIEEEILDRASDQSSIRKQLGLTSDDRRVRPDGNNFGLKHTRPVRQLEPLSPAIRIDNRKKDPAFQDSLKDRLDRARRLLRK